MRLEMEHEKWISTATFEEKMEPDQNTYGEARELVHSMAKRLTTCDKRKAAPPWLAPNELRLQLLLPNWRLVPNKAVGACQKTLETHTSKSSLRARWLRHFPPDSSRAMDIARTNEKLQLPRLREQKPTAADAVHSTPCMMPPMPSRLPRARRTPTRYTTTHQGTTHSTRCSCRGKQMRVWM